MWFGLGGTTLTTTSGYDYIAEVGWDAGGWRGERMGVLAVRSTVLPLTAAGKAVPDVSMGAIL